MSLRTDLQSLNYTMATLGANPYFREDIKQAAESDPNYLRRSVRLGTLALDQISFVNELSKAIATRPYRKLGHTVLGLGYHSVVLADGQEDVMKVLHRTVDFSEREQRDHISKLLDGQAMLSEMLDEVIVPQEYTIEPYLLDPSKTSVVARQRRMDGPTADAARPSQEMMRFMITANEMMDHEGFMPDIVGVANVFETADGLRLVDTVPLIESDPNDQTAIRHARAIVPAHRAA